MRAGPELISRRHICGEPRWPGRTPAGGPWGTLLLLPLAGLLATVAIEVLAGTLDGIGDRSPESQQPAVFAVPRAPD